MTSSSDVPMKDVRCVSIVSIRPDELRTSILNGYSPGVIPFIRSQTYARKILGITHQISTNSMPEQSDTVEKEGSGHEIPPTNYKP